MSNKNFVQRTACPACGKSGFTRVYSKPYSDPILTKYLSDFYNSQGKAELEYVADAEYTLQECNNCKLVFQEYIPDDNLMFRLYEHWIDPAYVLNRSQRDGLHYYEWYATEIINLITYFRKTPNELSFLDFGMGWAKWSMMAKAFGCDSYGMELSQERINYARNNGIKVIDWNEVPSHQFDYINTEQVFEHIPQPLLTMRHLSQALKPQGLIKISIPNGNGIGYKLKYMDWNASRKSKKSLMVVAPLEHINCYRTQSVIEMAKECGLENVYVPEKYIGFKSAKELVKNAIRPYYYKMMDTGDIKLFFRKPAAV